MLKSKLSFWEYPKTIHYRLSHIYGIASEVDFVQDAFSEQTVPKRMVLIKNMIKENKSVTAIMDNAGGIHEEVLPKIFDPFFSSLLRSKRKPK